RLAVEVPRAIERVHDRAGEIKVPLLLLHGTADRMVPPAGTIALYEALGGSPAWRLGGPQTSNVIANGEAAHVIASGAAAHVIASGEAAHVIASGEAAKQSGRQAR